MPMDYENDIRIDESALDVEWLNQPELMYKYAAHAAEMKKEVDEAKERMEVMRATLDADIRKNPEAYGMTKVTESAIGGAITIQPNYQSAVDAYNAAQYEFGIASAAVRAVDQRKTALENLVRLLTASYFAGPQAPRDLAQEWRKRQEEEEQRQKNAKVRIRARKERTDS